MTKRLVYAATKRCPCGAGLAYAAGDDAWDCSAILSGKAIPTHVVGSVQHTAKLPFVFYEIKSENQPSANGATTRPTRGRGLSAPPPTVSHQEAEPPATVGP